MSVNMYLDGKLTPITGEMYQSVPAVVKDNATNESKQLLATLDSEGYVGKSRDTQKLGGKSESALNVSNAATADNLKANGTLGGKAISTEEFTRFFVTSYKDKVIGRDLIPLLGASSAKDAFAKIRAMNGDYSSLLPGDYIDIPSINVGGSVGTVTDGPHHNLRVEIQGFHHYKNVGYPNAGKAGVLWGFRNCAFLYKMNPTPTNAGGYKDSDLRKLLRGSFAAGLEAAIGVPLQAINRLLETHGSWTWDEGSPDKLWLPTEVEVFGYQAWGRGGYYGGTSVQYPIYSIDPSRRVKFFNGVPQWWWEGTSDSSNSSYFCYVSYSGTADYIGAAYDIGVSPAFYI